MLLGSVAGYGHMVQHLGRVVYWVSGPGIWGRNQIFAKFTFSGKPLPKNIWL